MMYPSQPEPHRSFFNTDEAYSRAMANYREHEARRQCSVSISACVHAAIGVIMIGVVLFLVWQMVAAYLRAYPV